MGSPITPLIVRSGKLLKTIFNDGKLDLDSIGICKSTSGVSSRWLNFWDKDDVIAFPLAFFYDDPDELVKDIHVNIGSCFPCVHNAYWSSKKIVRIIAEKY